MMEYALDEDIPEEFKGVTLQINEDKKSSEQGGIANKLTGKENETAGKDNASSLTQPDGSNSNRKGESSTVQPYALKLVRETATNFFTFRADIVNKAIKECIEHFLDPKSDGELMHCSLLTEINLWDTEKERLVLLTVNTLVIVKYDFIALRRLEYRKISLKCVDSLTIGELAYPNASLMPNRNMQGIRIMWNKGQSLDFIKRWNPFSADIPMCTFVSHPLLYHKDCNNENQRKLYDVEEFTGKLCQVISNLEKTISEYVCNVQRESIILENYIGIGSLVHNRNALGFFKVRGKFSF